MSNESLPEMHYISERERVHIYPAIVRCISIPSIPSDFPFNAPISAERQYRGPRFTIGWLEFQSPDHPDPEVARPGDVWIQLPSGHRKARVYICYNPKGKDWSPWAGNNLSLGGRGSTPMHPFLNDHAQRRFYLVFNGSEFTWSNPKAVSIVMHAYPEISRLGPAEAVIKWLEVTGVGRTSPAPDEKVSRLTSVPMVNRKRALPDQREPLGDSASAPPAKKARDNPSRQQPEPSSVLPVAPPTTEVRPAKEDPTATVERSLTTPSRLRLRRVSPRLLVQVNATNTEDESGGDEDEDEEFARFVQITLEGIARSQEGVAYGLEGIACAREGITSSQEGIARVQEGIARSQEGIVRAQEGLLGVFATMRKA